MTDTALAPAKTVNGEPRCDSLVNWRVIDRERGTSFWVLMRCEGALDHAAKRHHNRHGKKWTTEQEAGGIDEGEL